MGETVGAGPAPLSADGGAVARPRLRPTGRSWALLGVALFLYLAANQTQVGWLYVMAALAAGAWLAGRWVSPGRMLHGLSLVRRINGALPVEDMELYAGHPVSVDLDLKNAGRGAALQVRGTEMCLFATAAEQAQPWFVPNLPAQASLRLSYTLCAARRGWFEFPPVTLTTRAPFGLFAASRALDVPTRLLIFPEYRELERWPLLDRMPAAENTLAHVGQGGEVLGVREYRPGDSRRHIHWRSSARAGRLIVKEFAEETQPGLTIALDARGTSVIGVDEATTLELAIRVAATLARYATRCDLPVTLAVNSQRWPAPAGALDWWRVMAYLARLQGEGDEPFADCLGAIRTNTFVAAIFTAPAAGAAAPLAELQRRGQGVMAVVINPAPFGGEAEPALALAGELRAAGLAVCLLGAEPDWERTLAEAAGV